ncbi:MAG: hypothetical protein KC619_22430 [Myxococcales bacterium]|nr:hypothetical protein [Myxococcales bacterium]
MEPSSLEGIADVERVDGAEARPDAPFDLLVEVPHGADRRAHYDALRARLVGDLPDDLHEFFHANTDTGAWAYGRRVAERLVALDPHRRALVVRCLVPRTFVDTNRLADATDELASGGLTAGVPSYVRDPADRALLLSMHRAYVGLVESAYDLVCGGGGFALLPHTYGPRSMGIARVDDDIVNALRAAWAPDAWASWPLRPEIDLITRDPDGGVFVDAPLVDEVLEAYAALGYAARDSETYTLHPSTQGARWTTRHPGQTLSLEVRRDLLVDRFHLLEELAVSPERVARVAEPLAAAIRGWLVREGR